MARILAGSCATLMAASGIACAGGIERSAQSVAPLFEDGRYLEFSGSIVSPNVSGVGLALTNGQPSGDILPGYLNFGVAYKADIDDRLSYAVILDQPLGANIEYPVSGYFGATSTAELKSTAITGLLKYRIDDNWSVYGGLRAQSLQADVSIPFASYTASTDTDYGWGYVIGAAYEIPEIALRVAATYNSEVDFSVPTVESYASPSPNTEVSAPDSINLEFQTGIAADTLLFGSVRWVDWSEFQLAPFYYTETVERPLVSYGGDITTYTLGLGRRLNETWSVAGILGYETENNTLTTNLGPTDGFWSVGGAATYTRGNMKVTAGLRYIDLGAAQTQVGAPIGGGIFEDNHAIAAGIRIGLKL